MTEYTNEGKDARPSQPVDLSPDSAGLKPEFSDASQPETEKNDEPPVKDGDPLDTPDEIEHGDYDTEHDVLSLEPDYDAEEINEQ